jgi:hypothetical protein
MEWSDPEKCRMTGSCGQGNENAGSIKDGSFLD